MIYFLVEIENMEDDMKDLNRQEIFTIDASVREEMMVLAWQESAIKSQAAKDLQKVRTEMFDIAKDIDDWASLYAWVVRISKSEERNANLQHAREVWLKSHAA